MSHADSLGYQTLFCGLQKECEETGRQTPFFGLLCTPTGGFMVFPVVSRFFHFTQFRSNGELLSPSATRFTWQPGDLLHHPLETDRPNRVRTGHGNVSDHRKSEVRDGLRHLFGGRALGEDLGGAPWRL